MKNLCLLLLSGFLLTTIACEKEDVDVTSIEEVPLDPTVVEVGSSILYRIASEPDQNSAARGLKKAATLPQAYNYLVISEDVEVDCSAAGGFSYSFEGGDLFAVQFYGDQNSSYIIDAFFDVPVGDTSYVVSSRFPVSPACPRSPVSITYTDDGDRLSGTVEGEFFRLADTLVSPFDSCVNFVSVGEISASFNVEIMPCN